jgi:hypothetical protein
MHPRLAKLRGRVNYGGQSAHDSTRRPTIMRSKAKDPRHGGRRAKNALRKCAPCRNMVKNILQTTISVGNWPSSEPRKIKQRPTITREHRGHRENARTKAVPYGRASCKDHERRPGHRGIGKFYKAREATSGVSNSNMGIVKLRGRLRKWATPKEGERPGAPSGPLPTNEHFDMPTGLVVPELL